MRQKPQLSESLTYHSQTETLPGLALSSIDKIDNRSFIVDNVLS